MIIVSACLGGVNCKYNGGNNHNPEILELVKRGEAILICPEQLGGCPTPRSAAEVYGGTGKDVLLGKAKVINKDGKDVTDEFIKGAKEALKIAQGYGAKTAILKSGSPSCGKGRICDGSFSGKKIEGNGVTAEIFLENGIEVSTETYDVKK